MEGCTDIAAIMAKYPETVIVRRFDTLHTKLCLILQSEIARREQELDDDFEDTHESGTRDPSRSQVDLEADQGSTHMSEITSRQVCMEKALKTVDLLSSYCKLEPSPLEFPG